MAVKLNQTALAQWIERWKAWAKRLKTEIYALYLAYRNPRTPWYARLLAACVVAYAFSPIDLIPDPIPILGYLDDLLLLPLGVRLVISLIPSEVMHESRLKAQQLIEQDRPVNWLAAAVIVAIWLLVAALAICWIVRNIPKIPV
jgi:uncharacterized membrane protein YkvA (DUF1232 family)